jgi:hypothetical protein
MSHEPCAMSHVPCAMCGCHSMAAVTAWRLSQHGGCHSMCGCHSMAAARRGAARRARARTTSSSLCELLVLRGEAVLWRELWKGGADVCTHALAEQTCVRDFEVGVAAQPLGAYSGTHTSGTHQQDAPAGRTPAHQRQPSRVRARANVKVRVSA